MLSTSRLLDISLYVLAVLFGLSAGILEVTLGDLLVTALFILVTTMVLGAVRPSRAWHWVVLVGVFVPLARVATYFGLGQQPDRAQKWESVLSFVVAAVGSYCGVFARKAVEELFRPATPDKK